MGQGKGLFKINTKINTVVDANNLISVRSQHSVGSHDLDQVKR